MDAVIVRQTLPTEFIAVDPQAMERALVLVAKAKAYVITDVATLDDAEATYRLINALFKSIADSRLDITRPIDDLKKAIMEAERKATVPLLEAKVWLEPRISKFRADENARRDEAARVARIEAERVAAIERKRLQDEQAERIRKATEERAAVEAKAKFEADMFGTEETVVLPVIPEEREILVVPVVHEVVAPSLGKSAVRTGTKKRIKIIDMSLIPEQVGGKSVWIFDEKTAEKLMLAGAVCPGCILEDVATIGAAGSRS